MKPFIAAVVQLNSRSDETANLDQVETLIERARQQGAAFVATPENTGFLGVQAEKTRRAQALDGPVCSRFAAIARRLGIHLLLGSFNERCPVPGRCHNTSVLFDHEGAIVATYRKRHLFDVDLPGLAFTESETVVAGVEDVSAETTLARFGLSICYDVRFPEMYRRLADRGVEVITVPSAFTRPTGRDHWEVLVRARAIETQCFVIAPAQWGRHDDEGIRESYGHAMIVDPWGRVLTDAGEGVGVAVAELDPCRLEETRRAIPCFRGRR